MLVKINTHYFLLPLIFEDFSAVGLFIPHEQACHKELSKTQSYIAGKAKKIP